MAKLNKALAKQVNEAGGGEFEPIPAGVYHVRLMDVDTSKEGPSGPYWSWQFDVIGQGGMLWVNTSLSEKALWKLKETFTAFGVSTDTDTDELCGKVCKALVQMRTIQQGDRAGELTSEVKKLMPADSDFVDETLEDTEDIFS